MSAIEILAVVGIIGFIIFKQVKGEALHGKRAVLLPAILTVIGFTDLHSTNGARLQTVDITCIVVSCIGSALIGLAFGAITRLEERGGYLWAQLPVYGLWLWAAMFGWRVAAMVVASGLHAHVAASSSTLLFSLGINRLAQAAVIVPRAMSMGVPFAPEKDGSTFLAGLFDRNGAQSPVGAGIGGYQRNAYGRRNDMSDRTERTDEYDRSGRGPQDAPGYDPRGYDSRGYDGGPVDLGREFGRDRYDGDSRDGRDSRDFDRDSYDRDRDRDRNDRQDYNRNSYGRDRDRLLDRNRNRRHDRDRRRGRLGDRW